LIILYLGLMGSGKTENLLNHYFQAKKDKKNKVLLVKSMFDRTKKYVQSRNGNKAIADLSLKPNEVSVIFSYIDKYKYSHVFIDEVEMFDEDIKYLVQTYPSVQFHLSGLERNFLKKPFGYLSEIKKFDSVVREMTCLMLCQNCKSVVAVEMFRLVDSKEEILIGDKEYIAVCNSCYDNLELEKTK